LQRLSIITLHFQRLADETRNVDGTTADLYPAKYTQLRHYLESYPISVNNNSPLNPHGEKPYLIILTHCHYDHLNGITQFLAGGTTEIIVSAAGKHFIESDLETHGLFKYLDLPVPYFQISHWATSFERLEWPLSHDEDLNGISQPVDLGITILHTPGHTPDELAWYDHAEMHLYVGDSLYEPGGVDDMPIEWPSDGNLIDWSYSMQKLLQFVRTENQRAKSETTIGGDDHDTEEWTHVSRRVKLGAGHQTAAVDAEEILVGLEKVWWRTLRGDVPVTKKWVARGEAYFTWRDESKRDQMYFTAPARLMDEARKFFAGGEEKW
jgi:glyoxylase-like metal-dependent hydrolase (beta-lactamase superfamily II)